MNETQISDVVLTTLVNDHELCFPQLFIIWNLIVIGFTLSNFENSSITLESDLYVLQLGSINTLKLELESLVWQHVGTQKHFGSLQLAHLVYVFSGHVFEAKVAKDWIILEIFHSWIQIILIGNAERVSVGIARLLKLSLVQLKLMLEGTITILVQSFDDKVSNELDDYLSIIINAHNMIVLDHKILPIPHVLSRKRLDFVHLSQLT